MALPADLEKKWIRAIYKYVSRTHPVPTKVVDIYPNGGNFKRQAKRCGIKDPGKEVTRLTRQMVKDKYLERVMDTPFQVRLGKKTLATDPKDTAEVAKDEQSNTLVTTISKKTRIMWCILNTPRDVAAFREYDSARAAEIEEHLHELLEAQYGDTLPAGIAQQMEMHGLDGICAAFNLDRDADHTDTPTVGETFKNVQHKAQHRLQARGAAKKRLDTGR